MEKIKVLTVEEFEKVQKANDKVLVLRRLIGASGKFGLGDTMIIIENSEYLGVYKNIYNGRTFYYLVTEVVNEEVAFAYSLYPINQEV